MLIKHSFQAGLGWKKSVSPLGSLFLSHVLALLLTQNTTLTTFHFWQLGSPDAWGWFPHTKPLMRLPTVHPLAHHSFNLELLQAGRERRVCYLDKMLDEYFKTISGLHRYTTQSIGRHIHQAKCCMDFHLIASELWRGYCDCYSNTHSDFKRVNHNSKELGQWVQIQFWLEWHSYSLH